MTKKINYDNNGIPILYPYQIEESATVLLREFDPKSLGYLRTASMEKLLEYIEERDGVEIGYEDLSVYGQGVLGITDFEKRRILIDEELAADEKLEFVFNFACGHEIGHWMLHRFKPITVQEKSERKVLQQLICVNDEIVLCESSYLSPKAFLEWQANSFAAALSMPEKQIKYLVTTWQQQNGVRREGWIYLDDQYINRVTYNDLSKFLIKELGVSKQAIKLRLKNLDILHEEGDKLIEILENMFSL